VGSNPASGISTFRFRSQEQPSSSQSYVRTEGQSASVSWCQAPIWDLRPEFFCLTVAGLLMLGALSDGRSGLSFTMYNVQYIYILHVGHECIYNIYKASISPGSVYQIMLYL
jgi:hypothetical protein